MISAWGIGAFLFWLGTGILVWKRADVVKLRARRLSIGARVAASLLLLFGGALALLMGLFQLQAASGSATLAPNQWVAIGFLGAAFVCAQCIAGIILFSIVEDRETTARESASNPRTEREPS